MTTVPQRSLIRDLANGGTTLEMLRRAIYQTPPEANLVLIQSLPPAIRFPPFCANCGQPAASTLRIERAFLLHVDSGSDTPNETVQCINEFQVPFCTACLAQQSAQQVPPNPWTPVWRILHDGQGLGGLIVLAVGLFFFKEAARKLSLVLLVFSALPLSTAYWLLRTVWTRSAHMSVPKPTQLDMAVDFTPFLSLDYEPAWLAFQFRSPEYAARFKEANAGMLWNPNSTVAKAAAAQRHRESTRNTWIVGTIVALILLWALWDEYLR